jgi:hypothetical protein
MSSDEESANGWILEDGVLSQALANEDFVPWGDRAAVVGEIVDLTSAREITTILQFYDYAGKNGVWAGITISRDPQFPDHSVTLILERSEDDNVRGGLLLIDGKEAARVAFRWDIRQPVQLRLELPGTSGSIAGVFADPETGEELLRLRSDSSVSLLAPEHPVTVFAACSAQYGYDINPAVGFTAFQGLDSALFDDDFATIEAALARLDFATARFLERRHFARHLVDQQENPEYIDRLSGMAEWSAGFVAEYPASTLAQRATSWEVRATQLANRTTPFKLIGTASINWSAPARELIESPWRDEYTRQLWKFHPHDFSSPEGIDTFLTDLYQLAGDETLAPYVRADVLYHSAVRAFRSGENAVAEELAYLVEEDFKHNGFRSRIRMLLLDVMINRGELESVIEYCDSIQHDDSSTIAEIMIADLYTGTAKLSTAQIQNKPEIVLNHLAPVIENFLTRHSPSTMEEELVYWAVRRGMFALLQAEGRQAASEFMERLSVDSLREGHLAKWLLLYSRILKEAEQCYIDEHGKFRVSPRDKFSSEALAIFESQLENWEKLQ